MAVTSPFVTRSALPLACALIFAAPSRRSRRRPRRPDRAGAAPRGLRSHARPRARHRPSRGRARAHPLRFRRQRLRGLHAEIPSGLRARFRRGQGIDQRSALDAPGKAATPSASNSPRKIFSTRTWSIPSTAMPSMARARPPSILPSRSSKVLDIDAAVVFPTQHMVRVIEAARAGKTILDFPVYDGSDTGDKVYNTLTVIGRKLTPGRPQARRCCGNEPKLADGPALAGDDQLFRKIKSAEKHRTDAGLCHQLRAL